MASNEPKKRSIVATLVANMLTEREDDFTANVTYVANRSIEDLCNIAANGKSKFTASELLAAHNDLKAVAKEELYSGSTVEFGLTNNSLGIDGPFIGPKAKFDTAKNNVTLRSTPNKEVKTDMKGINVIVGEVVEGLPTITKLTDVFSGSVNAKITPGNTLNGEGKRVKIVGAEGNTVGFFFINSETEAETAVSMTAVSRNDPSYFSFIIPALADGKYYLEIASQYGGNTKQLLKDIRRNRFPYLLTVGDAGNTGEDDRPVIE